MKEKIKNEAVEKEPLELRVWWIPQVPGKPFRVKVESVEEGAKLLNTLANYDLFQLANHIKPDYCNTGGLEVKEDDGAWCEWSGFDGEDVREIQDKIPCDPYADGLSKAAARVAGR